MEEWLMELYKKLDTPFKTVISQNTFEKIAEIAESPRSTSKNIHKVIGIVHARLSRGVLEIAGQAVPAEIQIEKDGILLLGLVLHKALGTKSVSHSIKKGGHIEWSTLEKLFYIGHASVPEKTSKISLLTSAIEAGKDKKSLCYNELLGMIGDQNSEVKMKAIQSITRTGEIGPLAEKTAEALEKEALSAAPNPVWSPGMLVLLGVCIYKKGNTLPKKENATQNKDFHRKTLRLLSAFVCATENEKILHGVLAVLWALTQNRHTDHLFLLAALFRFSKHVSVRRSAKGVIIEHLGRHPSSHNLYIMDKVLQQPRRTKALFSLYKPKKPFLLKYSHLLISQGEPERIKSGVHLRRLAREPGWACDPSDLFSVIAAARISLIEKNTPEMEKILSDVKAKNISLSYAPSKELLRLVLKIIRKTGVFHKNAQDIVMFALKKEVFLKESIKAIPNTKKHDFPEFENLLKNSLTYPGPAFALASSSKTYPSDLFKPAQDPKSRAYLSIIFLLGAKNSAKNTEIPKKAKTFLFSHLSCYDTSSYLGDVGSFFRFDALLLLSLRYLNLHTLNSLISDKLKAQQPYSLLVSQTTRLSFKLSPKEKHLLELHLVKLCIDKSRRIAAFIYTALLPSIEFKTKILASLIHEQQKYDKEMAQEDSYVLAVESILRKTTRGYTCVDGEKALLLSKYILEGLANSLLSADGYLLKTILHHFADALAVPLYQKTLMQIFQSISARTKPTEHRMEHRVDHRIEEIKKMLNIEQTGGA